MVVAVVDYGMGNLRSVSRALAWVGSGVDVVVTSDPQQVRDAERVVFPGVGAMGDCMAELRRLDLLDAVREAAAGKPFLGICLGMQALLERSEESGGVGGLGTIPGRAVRFPAGVADADGRPLKVPHMGWSRVYQTQGHPLWDGIEDGSWFYFVHSYYADAAEAADVVGEAEYGRRFHAAVAHGSCFAVQFHPEKSQHAGLKLLENFIRWDGVWKA